jgi:cell division protein ZapA
MGQINVEIGGRSYALACRDGEEARLTRLAGHLDRKAADLKGALGSMSEPRLLLMAGILVTDELFELREAAPGAAAPTSDRNLARQLVELAERVEALAEGLEQEAPSS